MHVAKLVAIILCCVFIAEARKINDAAKIANINNLSAGWMAGHNPRFDDMTEEQASTLLGLTEVPQEVSETVARDVSAAQGVPASFDARQRWPSCVQPIRDQGSCGACWAFAATSVFGMRRCIQSGGAASASMTMSPQVSVNCNTANNGCNGGTLGNAWEFFKNSGTVAETAVPFVAKKNTCSVAGSVKRYFAASYSRPNTVAAMQTAIYNDGAIQVGMDVYSDFYSYKSGVYRRTSSSLAGGHSVYLVGWGTDTSTGRNYWIAINSWGGSWGKSGSFWIERGVNMVNIEKGYMPVAGVVAASSLATSTTTTKAPTTTTKAPTTTTKAPTTTTRAPSTTTRAPSTTTKAPSTAAPARNCWTCNPGWVHWYDIQGMAEPSDKCACVLAPSTTRPPTTLAATKAATTIAPTRNCWTCNPGWVHWYDIQGMAEPSDKCACVLAPATTKPTSLAQITTKAATVAPTRNCWTCSAGWVHWYDIPNYREPADKCACVRKP